VPIQIMKNSYTVGTRDAKCDEHTHLTRLAKLSNGFQSGKDKCAESAEYYSPGQRPGEKVKNE
jgi:hypothetical protein